MCGCVRACVCVCVCVSVRVMGRVKVRVSVSVRVPVRMLLIGSVSVTELTEIIAAKGVDLV